MTMPDTNITALLNAWPNTKRHPLVAGNIDWDQALTPALAELGEAPLSCSSLAHVGSLLRVLFEIAYCMGYKHGIHTATHPMFVVADTPAPYRTEVEG